MVKETLKTTHLNGDFDKNGKFSKGNTAGKGKQSPEATHKKKLADAFNATVSVADLVEITKALVKEAKAGNVKAAKEVLDRCLGKPIQPLQVGGEDGGPIQFKVTVTKTYKKNQ